MSINIDNGILELSNKVEKKIEETIKDIDKNCMYFSQKVDIQILEEIQ